MVSIKQNRTLVTVGYPAGLESGNNSVFLESSYPSSAGNKYDASSGVVCQTLYGHLISRSPRPQHLQLMRPSGDAPRCGKLGFTHRPVISNLKDV